MFCPNPDCDFRIQNDRSAEFAAEVTHCSDCGAELVEVDPLAGREAEAERHVEFVELTELVEPASATLLTSLLDEAEIRYEIEGEGVQDFFGLGRLGTGFSPITGAPSLRVEAGRLEEAQAILASLDRPEPDPAAAEPAGSE